MHGFHGVLVISVAVFTLGACVDDLPEQWELTDTRLLSARYRPDAAPERAFAQPGESGELEFFITAPPPNTPSFTWGFLLCLGTIAPTGEALCLEAPFQTEIQTSAVMDVPAFPVQVPAASGGLLSHINILGIFCSAPQGLAVSVPDLDLSAGFETCEPAGGEVNRFQLSIPIEPESPNQHPVFASNAIAINGLIDPWPAPGPDPRCDGTDPTRPVIPLGTGEQDILLRTTAESQEPVGEDTEDLLFSHATSAGELDRFFSTPNGGDFEASVGWTRPGADSGSIVRFAFTLFDQRGGATWTLRELCLE